MTDILVGVIILVSIALDVVMVIKFRQERNAIEKYKKARETLAKAEGRAEAEATIADKENIID